MKRIAFIFCVAAIVFHVATLVASGQQLTGDLLAKYKAVLPKLDAPEVQEVFDSPRTIWYNTKTMGVWYQAWDNESLNGTFSAFRNVDANRPQDQFGNGNREYPWAPTLGGGSFDEDRARVKTLKGLLLPEMDGEQLPVILLRQRQPLKWSFPTGTKIVEVAWVVDSKGHWYPFETRFREREPNDWRTDRLLPYGTRDKLVAAVRETHPDIADKIETGKVTRVNIQDGDHPRRAISSVALVQTLPDFPVSLTRRLLRDGVQETMAGVNYTKDIDGPTTRQVFHIRPPGDLTQNHGNGERESCRQCHRDIDKHVRVNFERNRGWYGDIRGSDGIFSFYPHRSFIQSGVVVHRQNLKPKFKKKYEWSVFLVAEMTEPNR